MNHLDSPRKSQLSNLLANQRVNHLRIQRASLRLIRPHHQDNRALCRHLDHPPSRLLTLRLSLHYNPLHCLLDNLLCILHQIRLGNQRQSLHLFHLPSHYLFRLRSLSHIRHQGLPASHPRVLLPRVDDPQFSPAVNHQSNHRQNLLLPHLLCRQVGLPHSQVGFLHQAHPNSRRRGLRARPLCTPVVSPVTDHRHSLALDRPCSLRANHPRSLLASRALSLLANLPVNRAGSLLRIHPQSLLANPAASRRLLAASQRQHQQDPPNGRLLVLLVSHLANL